MKLESIVAKTISKLDQPKVGDKVMNIHEPSLGYAKVVTMLNLPGEPLRLITKYLIDDRTITIGFLSIYKKCYLGN